MKDARKDLHDTQVKADKVLHDTMKIVRPETVVATEYRNHVKIETDKNWKVKKSKMNKKVEFLQPKR